MPILEIELVLPPGAQPAASLARALADRAGEIFGSPPGGTWVRLRTTPRDQYAENGDDDADVDVNPVFVSVLKSSLPSAGALAEEAARLTGAIADVCGRPPENVHVVFQPEGAGRVAFGGKLIPAPEADSAP